VSWCSGWSLRGLVQVRGRGSEDDVEAVTEFGPRGNVQQAGSTATLNFRLGSAYLDNHLQTGRDRNPALSPVMVGRI